MAQTPGDTSANSPHDIHVTPHYCSSCQMNYFESIHNADDLTTLHSAKCIANTILCSVIPTSIGDSNSPDHPNSETSLTFLPDPEYEQCGLCLQQIHRSLLQNHLLHHFSILFSINSDSDNSLSNSTVGNATGTTARTDWTSRLVRLEFAFYFLPASSLHP